MNKKFLFFLKPSSARSQRGFTLLLAVLISSILIAIGSAIFNIVSKEIVLSSAGRESQFSFYAADTGIECALYWDSKDAFSTSSPKSDIACGGAQVSNYATAYDAGTLLRTTTFSFALGPTSAPCTTVTVVKGGNPVTTSVSSFGYNTCVLDNPLRLERAIRVQY